MSRVYVRSYVVRHDVGRALISGKVARGKFLPRQVCVLSGWEYSCSLARSCRRWENVKYDRERICLHCPRGLSERGETTFTLVGGARTVFSAIGPWNYIVPRLLWGNGNCRMMDAVSISHSALPPSPDLLDCPFAVEKRTVPKSRRSRSRISIRGFRLTAKDVNQTKQTRHQNWSTGFSAFSRRWNCVGGRSIDERRMGRVDGGDMSHSRDLYGTSLVFLTLWRYWRSIPPVISYIDIYRFFTILSIIKYQFLTPETRLD